MSEITCKPVKFREPIPEPDYDPSARWIIRNYEVKQDYPAADKFSACVIFDIAGNNYRLITKIDYAVEIVAIRKALTHAEYDKEKWKKDCDQN